MSSDLYLRAKLKLDSKDFSSGLVGATNSVRAFTASAKRELVGLRNFMGSTTGRVLGLAGGVSVAGELMRSAKMDQSLNRIGISADLSLRQVGALRSELIGLGRKTGESIPQLESASAALFAQGMAYDSVQNSLRAINSTMPLTTASAETLADALGVASTAFGFDLTRAGKAQELLDKMAMAGNQASAELQHLAPLVARVGVNARAGGFGYEQMLGFIEGLSKIERNPERLGTLADSTLRLFTNAKYLKDAQKSTGVQFFAKDGSRRDPLIVLAELKKRMDAMKTDAQRESYLSKAFGEADLDTIKGLRTLLTGSMLSDVQKYTANIANGVGTVERSLPRALNNAVSQTGRLRNELVKTADDFSSKLNGGITRGIKYLLDSKSQGGLGLSGGEIAGGAAAGTLAAYVGGRALKGAAGRFLGGTAGLASGVAMGTALEKAGAATPVFVVGAAPGLFGGGGALASAGGGGGLAAAGGGAAGGTLAARALALGRLSVGGLAGAGTMGAAGALVGGVGLAGVGGWTAGTYAHRAITSNNTTRPMFEKATNPTMDGMKRWLALFGNKEAQGLLQDEQRQRESRQRQKVDVGVGLDVRVTDTRVTVTSSGVRSDGNVTSVNTRSGPPVGVMMREGRR